MSFLPGDPRSWSIEQVVLMLEEIGLPQLAPAFRSNAVTGADLLRLSQQELQDLLGLTVLQARKVQGRVGYASPDPTPVAIMRPILHRVDSAAQGRAMRCRCQPPRAVHARRP